MLLGFVLEEDHPELPELQLIEDAVYVVAFARDSCGLFFRAQLLKLAT